MGTLKIATHYLIIILVMLRLFREFCLNTAFYTIFLTIASSSAESATFLINAIPKSSVLDNSFLTSSYYDLNWVLIANNLDRTNTNNISTLKNNQEFIETLSNKSTQQETREFIANLQDNSIPQDNQKFIDSFRGKSQANNSKNNLNLSESQKLLRSLREHGLQGDNSNDPIQGNSQTISQNLKQRYQDERLGVNPEDTLTLAQANKLVNSVSSEDRISALQARQLFSSDSKIASSKSDANTDFGQDLIFGNINDSLNINPVIANNNWILILGSLLVFGTVYVGFLRLFGQQIITEDGSLNNNFWSISGKLKIPNESVFLHNRLMQEIQRLAARLQQLDNDKFTEAEFLRFLRWESNISKGKNEFKELKEPIQLLKVGLDTKNIFLAIERTEFRYRGSGQQEFYNYITILLAQSLTKEEFRVEVDNKLMEILPILMTEEGKQALISYSQELYKLAETNLALKLMFLFRQNESQNYSVLKSISDIIEKTGGKNLLDPKIISSLVMFHYEDFEKVSKIIGLSKQQSTVENYTKILQYLSLFYRHAQDYYNFRDFIDVLKQWQKPYQSIGHIRQQYSAKEYDLPKDFVQAIAGEKIAKKYHEYT